MSAETAELHSWSVVLPVTPCIVVLGALAIVVVVACRRHP